MSGDLLITFSKSPLMGQSAMQVAYNNTPFVITFNGSPGPRGPASYIGWSPVYSIVNDGSRRVMQLTSWVGGTGTAPATGQFVGATGMVATAALAAAVGNQEVFVQQTRPLSIGPWMWWQTDASGNVIDLTLNDGLA